MDELTGNKRYRWSLLFNPTVAGDFPYSDEDNSAIQSATGATANTVTGGDKVMSGLSSSNQLGGPETTNNIEDGRRLGSSILGVPDTLVLCVTPTSGSMLDIEGLINWRELS